MTQRLNLLLILCLFCVSSLAQNAPSTSCGQKEIMQHFYATHPEYKQLNEQVETLLQIHKQQITSAPLKTQRLTGVVTLPVVVHIIHNNGTENISDPQVFQGIQHLNEAFANSGYYDPADGVNTQIQFCMAQRDPANNATNGITRDVSPYTVMGGANYYSDDLNVKDINRWNPLCYINIWLVKSIPTSVVGYAYLPSAHGSNVDGIIEEAAYFGSSPANDVVIIHETGHYLGLYHTFEGNCTNNDCTTDGDKVCDTPPDQSTAGVSCGTHVNSCTTDALSGFATDQNDLTEDYMDYGNFNCMKVFTQGQSDRMNWFIQNVRQSLLACKSCMNPCPAPVTADFISPAPPFTAGNSYTFTNTSVNAASYEWYVNNVLQSTASNFTYSFPATGSYTIKLIAKSASILCNDAVKTITITVVCGVAAGFTKSAITIAAGTNINFTSAATGADTYEWLVNGVSKSTATNFVYTSSVAGDYLIKLVAKNSTVNCQQEYTDTVHFTCSVIADFTPGITTTLINTPVTFTSTGTGATTYQWLVNGVIAGSAPTFTYTFTAIGAYTLQLIAGNGICSAAKTAIIYTTDKCGNAQYLFQKSYTGDGATNIYNLCATSDGGSVMTGLINRGTPAYATILKVDAAGNVQWMNTYADNRQGWFNKIKQTSDGGYIAIGLIIGTGGSNLRIFIVKTLSTGAIEWSREYDAGTNTSIIGTDIIQSTDGTYYFTSALPYGQVQGNSSDALIGKLDATGNINWLKTYDARFSEAASGIAEDKTQLIICGNRSVLNSSEGFLLKLNKTDGSVAWAKTYQSTRDIFNSVMVSSDGYYVDGLLGNTITGHLYLKTDFTGKLTYSKYTEPFGAASFSNAASFIKPNGNIISLENPAFTNPAKDFLVQEISPVTGILWTKKYNRSNIGMRSMAIAADNSIWLAGYKLNGVVAGFQAIDAYVMKLDEVGDAGECPAEKTNLELLPLQYTTADADFTAKNYQPQITTSHNITKIDVTVNTVCQHLIKCDSIPVDTCSLCDTLQLSGTDTVCSFTTTGIYSVARRPGCTAIPRWYLSDSTSGTITSVNDSTITIVFKKTGRFVLNSTINTGCKILKDTSGITVLNAPNTINLGPDIQLCKFSSIKLSAGPGFKSYLWNDGSVDSTLTAFNIGQYFVTAADYCGNIFSDTINLSQAPDVPFDLGPDLQLCNNDTLSITAPGNFLAYSWGADYNINTINGATVKVWPSTDTTYTVVAQVATGCTVVDTIRINVNLSLPLHIGNDTSFCAGDSLVLYAPAGFKNYLWQDGSTGTGYTTLQKGIYWLHAEAANGCISKDSVTVNNVYPLPVNFLTVPASICNGKNIELKATGNWSAYLWSNNAVSSAITVGTAGQYWLQVTSSDGCSGNDTLTVIAGDCGTGIHFPNAFTPDNNGFNDTYKPVVYTIPENFRLRIYNRFGEKVFETTDYKQGWDGTYKGKRQPPDTFVWYSVYQFTGSVNKMEKGTLILVR